MVNIKLLNTKWELTKKIIARVFIGFVLIFLYLPILWMILFSFTDTTSTSKWNGFSFEAYAKLFNGPKSGEIFTALGNTLIIAFSAAAIATILGTMAAIGMQSMKRKRLKAAYGNISQIPMVNADIITAVSLMLLFAVFKTFINLNGNMSMFTVILAHTTFCTPYVVLNVTPRLKQIDNSLYEAGLDLGCKPSQAIWKVIVPQILPGIIMGFIMCITLSIDDFVVSKFTIDGLDTLSTYIYNNSSGKRPLPVEVRALSSLMFLVVLSLLLAINMKNLRMNNKFQKSIAKGAKK